MRRIFSLVMMGCASAFTPAVAQTQPSEPLPVWVHMMTFGPLKGLSDGPVLTYRGKLLPAARQSLQVNLELRAADSQRTLVKLHHVLGVYDRSYGGGDLWLSADQVKQVGPLADGDYLCALTTDAGQRCSNVATLTIDAKGTAKAQPVIRLVPALLAPGDTFPIVWIIGNAPTPPDPDLINLKLITPALMVDGVSHEMPMFSSTGPFNPMKQVGHEVLSIWLESYQPPIAPKAQYKVKARVLGYESNEVTLPGEGELEKTWDANAPGASTRPGN